MANCVSSNLTYEVISLATTFFLLQHDNTGIYDSPKRVLDKVYTNTFFRIFKIYV